MLSLYTSSYYTECTDCLMPNNICSTKFQLSFPKWTVSYTPDSTFFVFLTLDWWTEIRLYLPWISSSNCGSNWSPSSFTILVYSMCDFEFTLNVCSISVYKFSNASTAWFTSWSYLRIYVVCSVLCCWNFMSPSLAYCKISSCLDFGVVLIEL